MLLCAPSCVTILSLFSSALWGRVRLWSASVPSVLLLLPVHERSAKLQPTADAPMIRKRLNHAGERVSRSYSCVADARPIVARSTSGVCEFEILVRFYNQRSQTTQHATTSEMFDRCVVIIEIKNLGIVFIIIQHILQKIPCKKGASEVRTK